MASAEVKMLTGTATSNGATWLTTQNNWTSTAVPVAADEAEIPSGYSGSNPLLGFGSTQTFGNFIINWNRSSTIGYLGASASATLNLNGVAGATRIVADGGAATDLLLLGSAFSNNTLTLGSNVGSVATGPLKVNLVNAGNFDIVNADAILASNSVISGAALTKTGLGTLIFSGNSDNTYTGLTISGGTVAVTGSTINALGASASGLTFNGGTLSLQNSAITSTVRSVTMTSSGTIDLAADVSTTFSGTVSGTGALTKTGPGTLTLTNTSNNFGGLTITGGTVAVTGTSYLVLSPATSGLTFNGGTLSLTNVGIGTTSRNVTLTGAGTIDTATGVSAGFSGTFSGGGSFTKSGVGTLAISGVMSGAGGVSVSSGNLILSASNSFTGPISISSGATLTLGSGGASGNASSASSIVNNGALIVNRSNSTNAITSTPVGMSGTGTFEKTGTDSWLMLGPSIYSGTTTVTQGTLVSGGPTALSSSSDFTVASGATLDVNGYAATVRSLAGGGTVSNIGASTGQPTLTLSGPAGLQSTFSGSLVNGGLLKLNLAKAGASTQILSGPNTYSGTTKITGGILMANTPAVTGSATGTGTVDVGDATENNATQGVLAGVGNISGAVSVHRGSTISGGTGVAGGAVGSTGVLTTGAQTWNGGGMFLVNMTNAANGLTPSGSSQISANAGYSQLSMNSLSVSPNTSSANFTIVLSGSPAGVVASTHYVWTVAYVTGAAPSSIAGLALDTSGFSPRGTFSYSLDTSGVGGGTAVNVSFDSEASPEPTTIAFGMTASLPFLLGRFRRRPVADVL